MWVIICRAVPRQVALSLEVWCRAAWYHATTRKLPAADGMSMCFSTPLVSTCVMKVTKTQVASLLVMARDETYSFVMRQSQIATGWLEQMFSHEIVG